ncbi:unnamed protein product [Arabidopsis lyrata]|uniref:Ethylene-responsive nuclear family protein n=1 Tax=Arabidopsis lyrata subsp. lyrata TaxID=81972 RepID=D7MFH4_ARALL|nr:uncharacterized protein LOC9305993 [Arabidopsis lyrata subsp. lyrata]EFH44130.1 hypothetical protein ARALYDRAFT_492798 [Arabidopsis lyrata subsp. lyrata]CAH8275924.1 unnamed protein product [Arabidopsis lyrata]|eukprot:XP_020874966.1 uncharacterized protein LOC9305993 [Arabidopsis lyrata subsp. lyrata]
MPLPWKKSKSSRISRFVSDLQQSPKHGGSLVVETGFPTSLIDLFVKNRDRLKKQSSKRNNKNNKAQTTAQTQTVPTKRRVLSPPPPPLSLQRRMSLPSKLDPALVTEDPPLVSKIEESFIPENRHDGEDDGGNGGNRGGGGGGCVLMVVVFKVFMVAVLALSTKKLAVGITLSAFSLLFLELAVARVFTYLNLCPDAQIRIDSLIDKLIGKRHKEKLEEEEESLSTPDRRNNVSSEIIEEPREEIRVVPQSDSSTLEKAKPLVEEKKDVQTIRDVVFKTEKSKSAKLKSKIVKKIVPKKLRSYKKKKKMKIKEKEEEEAEVETEEEGSVTEVSSLFSDERIGSEISERDDLSSNPPLLESCTEIEEEEEEEIGSKGDLTKAMVLIVIILVGLLSGKVFAIGLTLSWCLILTVFCCKSQTSL